MFSATINDIKSWKQTILALSTVIEEGTIELTNEGLRVSALDSNQEIFIGLILPATSFTDYSLNQPSLSISISFTELSQICTRIKSKDTLKISCSPRSFNLDIIGDTIKSYKLSIIDHIKPHKYPTVSNTASVKLAAEILKEAFKAVELVSGTTSISLLTPDIFKLHKQGDTSEVTIIIKKESTLNINIIQNASTSFNLEKLQKTIKAAQSSTLLSLQIADELPVRIEYLIGEGTVVCYVAPLIDNSGYGVPPKPGNTPYPEPPKSQPTTEKPQKPDKNV